MWRGNHYFLFRRDCKGQRDNILLATLTFHALLWPWHISLGLDSSKNKLKKDFAFCDPLVMVTATSVKNTNHRNDGNMVHYPFPPYFSIWPRNRKTIIKWPYYIQFYLFMDVLKCICSTTRKSQLHVFDMHICTDLKTQYFFFPSCVLPTNPIHKFLQWKTAACACAHFSWIYGYEKRPSTHKMNQNSSVLQWLSAPVSMLRAS